jgi:tight adherence protein C
VSTLMIVLVVVLVLAVAAATWAVQSNRRRVAVIGRASGGSSALDDVRSRIVLTEQKGDRAERMRETFERLVPDGLLEESNAGRLVRAGFDSAAAPAVYAFLRIVSALVLPGIALLFAPRDSMQIFALSVTAGVAMGLMLPPFVLVRMEAARQLRIRRSLPDVLDLLLVCVEAGVSLDAALLRVGKEMLGVHPELAEELLVVNRKTNAGMRREDALHGLFDRSGVEELRTLASSMIQSERWGSSIGRVLRVYSESLRRKRRHTAEKKAATAAPKMVVPMALFILPALFAVVGGPLVVGLAPLWAALGIK